MAFAYSLIIGLLSESAATPDDFVSSAKSVLFDPEQEATAKAIATSICASRLEIGTTVARAQLAGEVLPSLFSFDIVVDLRLRIVDREVKTFVPVAVIHIDTDVGGQEVWVQLSKGEVEDAIRDLSKCLDEMNFAETLTLRKS